MIEMTIDPFVFNILIISIFWGVGLIMVYIGYTAQHFTSSFIGLQLFVLGFVYGIVKFFHPYGPTVLS
jgi:hypothetical protein